MDDRIVLDDENEIDDMIIETRRRPRIFCQKVDHFVLDEEHDLWLDFGF